MTLPPLDYSRKAVVPYSAPPPHPDPEVPARPAAEDEIPAGARKVRKLAEAAGWLVSPTYARGTAIDRHGKPGALRHSLALRMTLPGTRHRAVAIWSAPVTPGPRKYTADDMLIGLAGDLSTIRAVALTAGLLPYLTRLTEPSTEGTVEGDTLEAT